MVKTEYGIIPDSDLVVGRFPNNPTVEIPNYLRSLVNEEIDARTSYIKISNPTNLENRFVSLGSIGSLSSAESDSIYEQPNLFKTRASNTIFRLPKVLSPKLAYFIGYFAGDGGMKDIFKSLITSGHYEYKFKVGDEFLIQAEFIRDIFKDLFGYEPPIRTERISKGENYYYFELTSKVVYRYLAEVFGFPYGSKIDTLKIPKLIDKSNKEIRKWFVRGFFDSDGAVKTMEQYNTMPGGNYVYLNIIPLKFVKEIIKILKKDFGVKFFKPSFYKKDRAWKTGTSAKENVIKLYKQKIFIHPIKRWRLAKLVKILQLGQ